MLVHARILPGTFVAQEEGTLEPKFQILWKSDQMLLKYYQVNASESSMLVFAQIFLTLSLFIEPTFKIHIKSVLATVTLCLQYFLSQYHLEGGWEFLCKGFLREDNKNIQMLVPCF